MARKKFTIDLNGGDETTAHADLEFQFYDADDSDSIISTANFAAVGSQNNEGTDGANLTFGLVGDVMTIDGVDVGTATNIKVAVKDEAGNVSTLSTAASQGGTDDYQDYLDSLSVEPSAPQQILQQQLVDDLKSAGVWDKADVITIFANDTDSANSLKNLKPAGLLDNTLEDTPTWTEDVGFSGGGTAKKVVSGFIMDTDNVNFQQDDASAFVLLDAVPSSGFYACGGFGATSATGFLFGSSKSGSRVNSSAFFTPPAFTSNFFGVRRNNSANVDVINGATITNHTLASASPLPDANFAWLGVTGTSSPSHAEAIQLGWLGAALNNTEIADLKTAFETYIAGL